VGFVESAIRLAAKVVRGERATAIPVERSMQFGLAINLRTARKLGIAVPPSLLLRAEEVFE
jgi:putative ABC transport system substrate-binding protein